MSDLGGNHQAMTTRHAAIYARISDDRAGAGLGVERQEKDCRNLARRLGWEVVEVFVDNDLTAFGKSKKSKPRPAYDRLVGDLAAGRFSGIIAWHTDRIHRTPRELEDFLDVIESKDVPVETVETGLVDLRTPSGRAVARTLCAWAHYESEHKSARTKAKYVQLAEAGLPGNGGFRPFGYSRDRLTVVEEEAERLRWVYAHVLAGRSLRSIVKEMNAEQVLTTQGGPWSLQGLRHNVLSPRNAGLREHRGVVVGEAVWPAVVDRATWQRACALISEVTQRHPAQTNARRWLLTGFLWCGRCGGKLVPRAASQVPRYGCLPTQEGGCGGSSVMISHAERFLVAACLARLTLMANLEPEAPHDPTVDLLARIAAEELRLTDLAAAFADDPEANPLELRAAGARIRSRIGALRSEIGRAAVTSRMAEPLNVRDAWGDYDLQQQRQVVAELLERVDVGPGVPGRFDPDRLTVTWR